MNNAFISYSHSADSILARALQSALEKFAKPWYKLRNLNVFQDNSSLTASPHLWTSIQQALAASEYFIYMASPKAAASKWVQKEIEFWLNNKSLETLIIVITDGNLIWSEKKGSFLEIDHNCLPGFLLNKFSGEPLYIDLRSLRNNTDLSLNNAAFKEQVLKIAAKLHNKEPKDLSGEALSAHRRTIRLRNIAISTLVVLFVLAAVAAWIANTKSGEAISEKNRAESNYLISEAQRQSALDPTIAIRLAEAAMKRTNDPLLLDITNKIYRENAFYKTILSEEYSANTSYNSFTCLEVPRDGNSFLVGSKTNSVEMYSLEGKLLREFKDFKDKITSITVSPNGQLIAAGAYDGNVKLWSIHGNLLHEYKIDRNIYSLSFSPDGSLLLLVSFYGARLLDLSLNVVHEYADKNVLSATFSPDNKTVLITEWETAKLLDYEGKVQHEYKLAQVMRASYSPNGQYIVAGFGDSTLQIWTKEGALVKAVTINGRFHSANFSPDGTMFVCASGDGNGALYDLSGNLLKELKGHPYAIDSRFLPNGKSLLTMGGGSVRLWLLDHLPVSSFFHADFISSVGFSPDGKTILTSSRYSVARLWTYEGKLIRELIKPRYEYIPSAKFSPEGNLIMIASLDFYSMYDLNWKLIRKVESGRNNFAIFHPNSKDVLVGLTDSTARIFDDHGKIIQTFKHKSGVSAAAFSPDGKMLLTATEDGFAYLWDIKGNILQEFKDYKYIPCVAFAPDGKSVATAGTNFIVTKWSLKGERLQEFKGHTFRINAIAFSPDGNQLFSCSSDNTAKVWNMKGEIVKEIKELANIASIAISADSKFLLTGSWNNTAKLWNTPKSLPDFLKSAALSELTNEQKEFYHLK